MSQSTDSKTNKNITSTTSKFTTDDKMAPTISKQGIKRSTSDEYEVQPNTKKIRHELNKEEVTSTMSKAADLPKFVSASKMINSSCKNVNVIPEISDEELLEMAIKFEKENPQ